MKVINFAFGLLMLVLTHSLRGGLPSSGFDTHVCGIVHGGSQGKLRHENIKKLLDFFSASFCLFLTTTFVDRCAASVDEDSGGIRFLSVC